MSLNANRESPWGLKGAYTFLLTLDLAIALIHLKIAPGSYRGPTWTNCTHLRVTRNRENEFYYPVNVY